MVALMRFTRDICRLLGLGSGSSEQRPEEMETGTPSDHSEDTLSQDVLNGEEGLSEVEKSRRRAERRRAKRKRQRERKKLEQVKKDEHTVQEEEERGGLDSELEDTESEAEEVLEQEQQVEVKEKVVKKAETPLSKGSATVSLASEYKGVQKCSARPPEEEPEWDVNSAFVANAFNHIRPKAKSKEGRKSKENKENEARSREVSGSDSASKSALLTEKGIKLVQEGQYTQAVLMFTEAIRYDPKDYRFFGNRSYCYYCLEQYPQALADAEKSIQMASEWPKGYYRKGSALMGLMRYSEAEKAMEQVLKLDKDCDEAVKELFYCKVLQLMDLGYEEEQSELLLEKYSTVQAVLEARANNDSALLQPGSPCPSLWVGNVTREVTEKHLRDIFKNYGEIDSIRVLHERFCAFVNFRNANMALRAMEQLNGYEMENTRLVVRYPDRRTQRPLPVPNAPQSTGAAGARRRGPVNGDECYFWRTTGCHFGDKCHYKHIPEQRGKDRKLWQP
ncbi:hsp70-Hsp90 organizing protein 3 isoform X2 [Electrophorus electricus]|uniref:hsp70-Hsp90 organizing protein 3 isoform X2 n=1 Tax=Electrophorus electricus TaxID=8005 RepID=UPI0015D0A4A7|nr:hsp70-Hsp90 organizing protein 3 isoform X2 [Electrophorus electricus]